MATFKKGQSFKDQRVYVSAVFDQKGKGMTGKNVAFSISNDTREPEDVITDPMLMYGKYKDKEGVERNTYTVGYSAKQWEAIEKMANKDGDAMVLNADLFPNPNGKGLVVNTNTLSTPETPFDAEKHRANTLKARQEKSHTRTQEVLQTKHEATASSDKELEI